MTPRPRSRTFHVVRALALVAVVVPCLAGGLLTVRNNYRRFPVRAKQAECKSNLRAWHTAQRAYHQLHNRYEPDFSRLPFTPVQGNRYAYFAGAAQVIGVDTAHNSSPAVSVKELPASVAALLGPQGDCPRCDITAACAANIDQDATLDVWVISTGPMELRGTDGEGAVPGEPVLLVDDSMD